jgi:hypothetical protein
MTRTVRYEKFLVSVYRDNYADIIGMIFERVSLAEDIKAYKSLYYRYKAVIAFYFAVQKEMQRIILFTYL